MESFTPLVDSHGIICGNLVQRPHPGRWFKPRGVSLVQARPSELQGTLERGPAPHSVIGRRNSVMAAAGSAVLCLLFPLNFIVYTRFITF